MARTGVPHLGLDLDVRLGVEVDHELRTRDEVGVEVDARVRLGVLVARKSRGERAVLGQLVGVVRLGERVV